MRNQLHGWMLLLVLGAAGTAQATGAVHPERGIERTCIGITGETRDVPCSDMASAPSQGERAGTLGDPASKAEGAAWQQEFDTAMHQRAQELAARGDARSLLAATLIMPAGGDTGLRSADPAEAQGWFDQARRADPADPLVAWLEMTGCPALACDPGAALARLLQFGGDNAAVQARAVDAAMRAGNEIAARTHLHLGAQARHFDAYGGQLLALLLDAYTTARQPAWDPAAAAMWQGPDAVAMTAADLAAMHAMASWAALSMSPMQEVMQLCDPHSPALGREAALRQDCIGLLGHFASDESMALYPAIALPGLIALLPGGGAATPWRERLRELAWLQEQVVPLLPRQAGSLLTTSEYLGWVAHEGELGAWRKVLQRQGIPIAPPAGWSPASPRYRELLADMQ